MSCELEYITLHTGKNTEETEKILKQHGWEIVYISYHDDIYFDTLNEDEKIGWLEEFEESLEKQVENLQRYARDHGSVIVSTDNVKKIFSELLSMLTEKNQLSILEKYDKIVTEMKIIDTICTQITHLKYAIKEQGYPIYNRQIQCSRIIAKKGSEKIRYLEFSPNPILTITGPKAIETKSSLEGKL